MQTAKTDSRIHRKFEKVYTHKSKKIEVVIFKTCHK